MRAEANKKGNDIGRFISYSNVDHKKAEAVQKMSQGSMSPPSSPNMNSLKPVNQEKASQNYQNSNIRIFKEVEKLLQDEKGGDV